MSAVESPEKWALHDKRLGQKKLYEEIVITAGPVGWKRLVDALADKMGIQTGTMQRSRANGKQIKSSLESPAFKQ